MQHLAYMACFSLRQLEQSIHLGRVDFPLVEVWEERLLLSLSNKTAYDESSICLVYSHWDFQEPGPEQPYALFTIKVNLFLNVFLLV